MNSRPIIAGIRFDEGTESVLQAASALARKSDSPLHLVHVVEPWDRYGLMRFLSGEEKINDMVQTANAEQVFRATELMAQAVERLKIDNITLTTAVLEGAPAQLLIAEANRLDAGCIVAGITREIHNFDPKNLSDTLSLASESPVSVMFIPPDAPVARFKGDDLRILACDDLTPSSLQAVLGAHAMNEVYSRGSMLHVHISSLTEDALKVALAQAFTESRSQAQPVPDSHDIFGLMAEALQRQLIQRLPSRNILPKRYQAQLRFGNVSDELKTLVADQKIDLIVCGRHMPLHKEPYYVGNMPYHVLFNLEKVVMVVPEEGRLSWIEAA